jgi:hypothetical protein
MKNSEISGIRKAYARYIAEDLPLGKSIDEQFIRKGYVGVEAEIDLLNKALGELSYDAFIEMQSSPDAMSKVQRRDEEIRSKFSDAKKRLESIDGLIKIVVEDSVLPGQIKYSILRRYVPHELDELLKPHMPHFQKKINEEQESLCRLYPPPQPDLHSQEKCLTRKEIYNSVAADAYAELGFVRLKANRKTYVLAKKISQKLLIVIECDVTDLEKDYSCSKTLFSTYWPNIPINRLVRLFDMENSKSAPLVDFGIAPTSIAATRLFRYSDSCSLEIAVRAHATWYEMTVSPFEEILRDF